MRRGPARGVPPWVPMQVALAPQAFLSISTCPGTQGSSQAGAPEVWTPACLPCHPALSYSLCESSVPARHQQLGGTDSPSSVLNCQSPMAGRCTGLACHAYPPEHFPQFPLWG